MAKRTRDPVRLGGALQVWLYVYLAATAAYGVCAAYSLYVLTALDPDAHASFSESAAGMEMADLLSGLVGLVVLVTVVVCYVLSAMWLFRVSRNAGSFAAADEVSPAWSVGWFFIPIANFFMPFRRVRKIWQITRSGGQSWRKVPVPALLRWWWAFWLATTILDNLSFRLQLRAETVADYGVTLWIDLVSALLTIPLVPIWAAIVNDVSRRQSEAIGARQEERRRAELQMEPVTV